MFHVKHVCAPKVHSILDILGFIGMRGLAHGRGARVGSYYWAENALLRAGNAIGGRECEVARPARPQRSRLDASAAFGAAAGDIAGQVVAAVCATAGFGSAPVQPPENRCRDRGQYEQNPERYEDPANRPRAGPGCDVSRPKAERAPALRKFRPAAIHAPEAEPVVGTRRRRALVNRDERTAVEADFPAPDRADGNGLPAQARDRGSENQHALHGADPPEHAPPPMTPVRGLFLAPGPT
ncbi:MAG: hypothetical protein CHACPFDD_01559 [Phycisphaerae bacterium]|nr:hypothetical protein [Phycisphaerae bacterium]